MYLKELKWKYLIKCKAINVQTSAKMRGCLLSYSPYLKKEQARPKSIQNFEIKKIATDFSINRMI